MELLLLFVILTVLNTIIQTVKSITTIKCGKWVASLVNAIAYGLYTYVIFFTSADGIDLHTKALITAFANLIGVYVVKLCEEKARKDKLWKVEATIHNQGIDPHYDDCLVALRNAGVPHNYIDANKYLIINAYCATQAESRVVKAILDQYDAKYFVSESKTL